MIYEERSGLWDNQWQNILQKVKKSKQNWIRPENLDISFCINFDHYHQKLIFRVETWY